MNEQTRALLKSQIDRAELVSFDIFDTLLFRKTNTPETVFDLVGKHFGIHGFRKLRMDEQNEASTRAYAAYGYPHADMDQIYAVLSEHTEIPVDWNEVKEYEIRMERDALTANRELLEIFRYAKASGKRVVATSDMYLPARILWDILKEKGFEGLDYVYCSADEHKAKFNRDLFEVVAQKENVPYGNILHIGDKERDDGEYPAGYGIRTFVYHADADLEKLRNAVSSDVDRGIYKILADRNKGFWYNLGVEVGGPMYMGLYRFLMEKAVRKNRKIFFLSRDGYNLYRIFQSQGFENIEYLYTSRRAMTMAAITGMDEADIATLPPYTTGQTVGELLDYLCVDRKKIAHLTQAGFDSFDDVIRTEQDRACFRSLYTLDKEVFLERCRVERENALAYYNSVGFLDGDAICFDCGWQGSSQALLERFKKAIGSTVRHEFVYFGIRNSARSRQQLRGCHYDAFLFDFYQNHSLQIELYRNPYLHNLALAELFFSAPHESVYYYGENGEVVFEDGQGDPEKADILAGIQDYIRMAGDFVEKYDVEFTPEIAMGHLKRLIQQPTQEEAVAIGDLQNVDGFGRKQGQSKFIAYVTKEQLAKNPETEVYWLNGLLKRPDVPEDVKKECASRCGVAYPAVVPEYHLEDEQSIRNYHRFLKYQEAHPQKQVELTYKPSFSVVIPVYNTVTEQLDACFQSVLAQTYDNFELILVDDHSSWENVAPVLRRYETDDRVQVIYRTKNGHISAATNDGIARSSGDFIVFMDCDDTVEPDALYQFAKKLNENPELDFIYSDEDKLTEDGKLRHLPFFKPDWSPDLFLNMNYTNHLSVYRTSIVKQTGGLRTAYNGSQDYDFVLRFMEKSHNTRVGHIPRVLYHWRERKESVAFSMSSKNYASEAARWAKEDYIRRNNLKARLEYIEGISQYRIIYQVEDDPLVSIIIPSRDHPEILIRCLESIRSYTSYRNYEFIVVDNGSTDENRQRVQQYLAGIGGRYVYEKADFNFSRMCNDGAARARGEYLLFLNDDIEIFQPQWLERMLGHAQQKHVGAVGAKLFYPETTVLQHIGVSNPDNGPLHSFVGLDDESAYYFGWNRVDYNCIGVTGACLLLEKNKFRQVGGFDEELPVAYNDAKLCFALHGAGYYNVVRTDVFAYHHESLSRGSDQIDDRKLMRMSRERTSLFASFEDLKSADPYLNENLSHWSDRLDLKCYYDELREMDLSDCTDSAMGSIDIIDVSDRIRILGWAALDGQAHPEKLERYLVLKDPFGRTYGAKVLASSRADVADSFGSRDFLYAGFECVLRKSDARMDIIPYRTGVMIRDAEGKCHLRWCRESSVIRESKPRPCAGENRKLERWEKRDNPADVQWYLDECSRMDFCHRIRGFAFKRGDDHYRYRKTLILQKENGEAWEFEVQPEERVDVAYTFWQEHFLYNTGFVCYAFDDALESGGVYDVIIRLENQFDPEDVIDISTGGKLRL